MLKKNFLTLWVLVFSLLLVGIVSAQEATPGIEPTKVPVTVTEGGDSISLLEVIRAELQPLGVLVLFTALGTGAWVIIEGFRALRNRNVQVFTIVLDGVEYAVKVSRNKIDDRLFAFFRSRVERKEPTTIEELRDDINRANR